MDDGDDDDTDDDDTDDDDTDDDHDDDTDDDNDHKNDSYTASGAAPGVGIVFYALIQGTSRNPSVKNQLFQYAVLGFALSEATGLFALMVSFMILFS